MNPLLYILLLTVLLCYKAKAQLYIPNVDYYNGELNRVFLTDSANQTYYNSHLSLKPVLDKRTNPYKLYKSEGKFYYWITQKLFKENFIIFEGEDFWCSIDPIVDLELGSDLALDSLQRMYWNTRGLRVQARFFNKVAFSTSFYENQAVVPFYQQNYFDSNGEFFPNSNGTSYTQNNAVIPGYARTKPFKQSNGYDFAFAEGAVSFVPNKWVNFQFGNGNQFIGNGYRSLLLSDFTVNYPFGKIETNFFNGRVQYNLIYAVHQNLFRISTFSTPEATYERKIGTYHYLDVAVTKHLQLGIFEGSQWRRTDSAGTVKPDLLLFNPLIGSNTAIKGFEADGYYSILGLNATLTFGKNRFYGQAVLDKARLTAFQIGLKAYDLLTSNLDVGLEYNHADLNTYLSAQQRFNYSHYNLPLAHPLTAGFDELIVKLSYQKNRFFATNQTTYSKRIQNDSTAIGNAILGTKVTASTPFNRAQFIVYNQLEIGYRFNKNYNLEAVIGYLYRNETQPTPNPLTNYTYIGVRTRLRNKTLNF